MTQYTRKQSAQPVGGLTCAVHVVSGQLEQPHVLVGDGIKGATREQHKRNTAGGHDGLRTHITVNAKNKQKQKKGKENNGSFGCINGF